MRVGNAERTFHKHLRLTIVIRDDDDDENSFLTTIHVAEVQLNTQSG